MAWAEAHIETANIAILSRNVRIGDVLPLRIDIAPGQQRAVLCKDIVIPKSPFVFISVFGITILSTGSGPPGGTTNSYPPKNTVKPKVCQEKRSCSAFKLCGGYTERIMMLLEFQNERTFWDNYTGRQKQSKAISFWKFGPDNFIGGQYICSPGRSVFYVSQ